MSDEIRYKNKDGTISFPGLGMNEINLLEVCKVSKATDSTGTIQ